MTNKKLRRRSRYPREVSCDVCGKLFSRTRKASTCSARCRKIKQRDYQRQAGKEAWRIVE